MKYSVLIAERRGAATIEDAERISVAKECYDWPVKQVGLSRGAGQSADFV